MKVARFFDRLRPPQQDERSRMTCSESMVGTVPEVFERCGKLSPMPSMPVRDAGYATPEQGNRHFLGASCGPLRKLWQRSSLLGMRSQRHGWLVKPLEKCLRLGTR
jgi:hypothetical protein